MLLCVYLGIEPHLTMERVHENGEIVTTDSTDGEANRVPLPGNTSPDKMERSTIYL